MCREGSQRLPDAARWPIPIGQSEALPVVPPIGMLRILDEVRVPVASDGDVVTARQRGRLTATEAGFHVSEGTLVAVVISELARNILRFAAQGAIILRRIERDLKQGIEVVAVDEGPGIPDVALAMREGYSTSGGLGMGLACARRVMDELEIVSRVGTGTTVTGRKMAVLTAPPGRPAKGQLVAEGRSTKEIAQLLGIKYKTAEPHRTRAKIPATVRRTS